MEVKTCLLIAILQLTTAQQQSDTIPLVVIPGSSKSACHSQKVRESIELAITNIKATLKNVNTILECGDGLWYRVAHLNMSDPTQQCPAEWRLYNTSGVRACGRPDTSGPSCPATFYPTGRQYSKVCGRIIAYQFGTPGAFYIYPSPTSLDAIYVDEVSISHGQPRSHIWTLAAGETEGFYPYTPGPDCPCSRVGATEAPSYVGNNYYCESGKFQNSVSVDGLYINDPLWDGEQCEGQCCSNGKSPPWFSVQLQTTTTDDIEVRICADEVTHNEDTPIGLMEIYVS